jgi:putative hydrolase of the HAD superfamily
MTFLYDIGRVLLDFDFETSIASLLPPGTGDARERIGRMLARKDEFESGKLDVDTYTNWALEVLETNATPEQFHHAWRNIFTPNEPMWQRVRQLKAAGHRLILFSNINPIHVPWIYDEYPDFHLFHHAVMSFRTGFVKPDPDIYQHAVETHNLIPAETLYIDDLPDNIVTGRVFGFHCHQYDLKNHSAFEQWLSSFRI